MVQRAIDRVTDKIVLQKFTDVIESLKNTVVVLSTLKNETIVLNKYSILDRADRVMLLVNGFYQILVNVKPIEEKDTVRVCTFYMNEEDVDNYCKGDPLEVNEFVISIKDLGQARLDEF